MGNSKIKYIDILSEENGAALYSGIKKFIDNCNYRKGIWYISPILPDNLLVKCEDG